MPTTPDHPTSPSLTCTTPDGVELAVYDFGGSGPDLLLVHATGFCAGVLYPVARRLSDRFRCHALDLRGHGRSDRPADGNFAWSSFGVDVLTAVDRLGLEGPWGFGHSCGGASLLLAEQTRPGTFRSLYLFEPVVVPAAAASLPDGANSLAQGARRRRSSFPSFEDAFANFSSKPPFGDLDPEALRRYVEDGLEVVPEVDGGDGTSVRLRCDRDDEAEVYLQGSGNGAFERLPEVACPVVFAYGEATDALGRRAMEADAAQTPRATVEAVEGVGHFGPLQSPGAVAGRIDSSRTAHDDTTPS